MPIPTSLKSPTRTSSKIPDILKFGSPEEEKQFKRLLKSLEYLKSPSEIKEIEKAFSIGCEAHKGQMRKSGGKYITHPLEVAQLLADIHMDKCSIIAGILHDTLEDTDLSQEILQQEFGSEVVHLVEGVSKISNVQFESPQHAEAANFSRMFMAMTDDIRVILIKLADRIHNLRSLHVHGPEKRKRIAQQTMDIYVPIATRLGIFFWQKELENLCFQQLHPYRHRTLSAAIRRRSRKSPNIKDYIKGLEKLLKEQGISATVSGRQKDIYAIHRKMQRTNQKLDSVKDIHAFRIIVESEGDCYLALGAVHKRYKPVPGAFNDYIAMPKFNGYQSLHTKVFGEKSRSFEVQIRTESMHMIAEMGIASHLRYKAGASGNGTFRGSEMQWLNDVISTSDMSDNPGEFLDHIKLSMYPDDVYVRTPRGEVKQLPKGATAIDFAYAVHSDIGHKAVSAVVNNQPVPLHRVLESGDHVFIKTSRFGNPQAEWLDFAVSGKARTAIRYSLRQRTRKSSIEMGVKLLKKSLQDQKVRYSSITENSKKELVKQLQADSWEQVLYELGIGSRIPSVIVHQLLPESDDEQKTSFTEGGSVAINGTEGLVVSYAKCCHPIPGDSIIGHLTTGRGIVIHTDNCTQTRGAKNNMNRWNKFHWTKEPRGRFAVPIRLDAANRKGVLAKIATTIAEQKGNISDCKFSNYGKEHVTMDIVIEVENRDHLAQIMREIRSDKSVYHLLRVRSTKVRSHPPGPSGN